MNNSNVFPSGPVKISSESLITEDPDILSAVMNSFGAVKSRDLQTGRYKVRYFILNQAETKFSSPLQIEVMASDVIPIILPKKVVFDFMKSIPSYIYEPNLERSSSWLFSLMFRVIIFSKFERNHINKYYLDLFKKPTDEELKFISGFNLCHDIFDFYTRNINDFKENQLLSASLDVRNWGDEPPFNSLNPCVCKRLAFEMTTIDPFFFGITSKVTRQNSFAIALEVNLRNAYLRIPGKENRSEATWNGRPSSFLSCQKLDFKTKSYREDLLSLPDSLRIIFRNSKVICVSKSMIQEQLKKSVETKRQIFVPFYTQNKKFNLSNGFYYNIFIGMPFNFLITQESYLRVFKQEHDKKNFHAKISGYFDFVELIDAINGVVEPKTYTEFFYDLFI